jgi:hypothetical protein
MYLSLTEDNDSEIVSVNANNTVNQDTDEPVERDVDEIDLIKSNDILEKAEIDVHDSRFALV